MHESTVVTVTPKTPGTTAPKTVSGAVRLAIADGRTLLETDDRYAFDHAEWYTTDDSAVCAVCAAGAVMARRFDIVGRWARPRDFDEGWRRTLEAINAVRDECFESAWERMVPGPGAERDGALFADEVIDALEAGGHGADPDAQFATNEAYARFLDRLESTTLPAIEHAEAEVARRTREKAWRDHAHSTTSRPRSSAPSSE